MERPTKRQRAEIEEEATRLLLLPPEVRLQIVKDLPLEQLIALQRVNVELKAFIEGFGVIEKYEDRSLGENKVWRNLLLDRLVFGDRLIALKYVGKKETFERIEPHGASYIEIRYKQALGNRFLAWQVTISRLTREMDTNQMLKFVFKKAEQVILGYVGDQQPLMNRLQLRTESIYAFPKEYGSHYNFVRSVYHMCYGLLDLGFAIGFVQKGEQVPVLIRNAMTQFDGSTIE